MGKVKDTRTCSVCGGKFSSSFKDVDYCNKHYLRMYFKGTTEPSPYKTKNTYKIIGDIAYGKTTKGIPFMIDADDIDKCKMHTWCRDPRGYFAARIDGKTITLHRFIYGIHMGGFTSVSVDHINGDRSDNRKCNIRKCKQLENGRNIKIKSSNTSGYPGVRLVPSGKFAARIMVNRKEIFLGTYDSIEKAIEARVRAEKKYFGEFSPTLSRNRKYHSCDPRIEMEVTEVEP